MITTQTNKLVILSVAKNLSLIDPFSGHLNGAFTSSVATLVSDRSFTVLHSG